jgi:hypothetical protein
MTPAFMRLRRDLAIAVRGFSRSGNFFTSPTFHSRSKAPVRRPQRALLNPEDVALLPSNVNPILSLI